jgi:hypothetical protein
MSTLIRSNTPFKLALICLAISVSVNAVTAFQLSHVRGQPRATGAAVGEQVPRLTLVSNRAEHVEIQFSKEQLPTLFYWFSPTCGWCELNLPNFEALAAQANGRYRFLPVADASPADLAVYAEKYSLTFPLYSMSGVQSQRYHFRGTPSSLLVSANGTVLHDWYGAYRASTLVEVEKTLGVNLPGMAANPSEGAR